jgi:hypothetical protein
MKDRDTTQITAVPFGLVLMELGINRLEEGAHEGDLPCWTDNGAFEPDVIDCTQANGYQILSRV